MMYRVGEPIFPDPESLPAGEGPLPAWANRYNEPCDPNRPERTLGRVERLMRIRIAQSCGSAADQANPWNYILGHEKYKATDFKDEKDMRRLEIKSGALTPKWYQPPKHNQDFRDLDSEAQLKQILEFIDRLPQDDTSWLKQLEFRSLRNTAFWAWYSIALLAVSKDRPQTFRMVGVVCNVLNELHSQGFDVPGTAPVQVGWLMKNGQEMKIWLKATNPVPTTGPRPNFPTSTVHRSHGASTRNWANHMLVPWVKTHFPGPNDGRAFARQGNRALNWSILKDLNEAYPLLYNENDKDVLTGLALALMVELFFYLDLRKPTAVTFLEFSKAQVQQCDPFKTPYIPWTQLKFSRLSDKEKAEQVERVYKMWPKEWCKRPDDPRLNTAIWVLAQYFDLPENVQSRDSIEDMGYALWNAVQIHGLDLDPDWYDRPGRLQLSMIKETLPEDLQLPDKTWIHVVTGGRSGGAREKKGEDDSEDEESSESEDVDESGSGDEGEDEGEDEIEDGEREDQDEGEE